MKLKRFAFTALFALAAVFGAMALRHENMHLLSPKIERAGHALNASWALDAAAFRLHTDEVVRVIPVLRAVNGADSVELTPMTVAGKNAWYHLVRENKMEEPPMTRRAGGNSEAITVTEEIPWQDWMENSVLALRMEEECCGRNANVTANEPIAEIDLRTRNLDIPLFVEVAVQEAPKMRSLAGRAFVNFPVNRTEIFPEYMSNPSELRKILNTIDSVRLNPDFTVKGIWLTGYASPEGPYKNNVRLAAGRTESLKEYVRKQYSFPADLFHTNSVPEDWSGLREYVALSAMPEKEAILAFIDDNEIPIEVKNDRFKAQFPKVYPMLLKEVYPSLRHTDYEIQFQIKEYTDVEEIKRVVKTAPQQLNLSEFMMAAQSYGAGTKEAEEVMEIAARMFPDDPTANLNAATAALRDGAFDRAATFLEKAGDSAEAEWARAVLAVQSKDYQAAEKLLLSAQAKGLDMTEQLENVRAMIKGSAGIKLL